MIAFVYPLAFADKAEHWERKMHEDFRKAITGMEEGEKITYQPILCSDLTL